MCNKQAVGVIIKPSILNCGCCHTCSMIFMPNSSSHLIDCQIGPFLAAQGPIWQHSTAQHSTAQHWSAFDAASKE
jgi:hypothetical protein